MAITRNEFATRVLHNSGIESRKRAVICLTGWMFAESGTNPCNGKPGEGAKYNPLNTTLSNKCTVNDYNTTGVKNYSSERCGIVATTDTLKLDYYNAINRVLKNIMMPGWRKRFAKAVGESPWGTSEAGVLAGIKAVEDNSKYGTITVGP